MLVVMDMSTGRIVEPTPASTEVPVHTYAEWGSAPEIEARLEEVVCARANDKAFATPGFMATLYAAPK